MITHTPHPDDDDLVLHYYGEHADRARVDTHLAVCAQCAAAYRDIVATLALVVDDPAPVRGEHYGLEVWQRLRAELPSRRDHWWRLHLRAASAMAAALALSAGAFVAGRHWPVRPSSPATAITSALLPGADERVRAAALSDHLDRSERLLVELANGGGAADIQHAGIPDLVDNNRILREAAFEAGDVDVAGVLDDLERALLDLEHAPAPLTPGELTAVRARLDEATLLFKIRILSMELRDRESAPVALRKTT